MKKIVAFAKQFVPAFLSLTFGAVMAAFAVEEFLVPTMILDGGIVGVSIMISQLTGVTLGLLTFVLNIPFLLIGAKNLGKNFLISALYSMLVFSVMLSVFAPFVNATEDPLLAVVFGGLLLGAGIGLVLQGGGCLDGTETVALLISRKTQLSVGQVILVINVVIFATAGVLFGLDRAMYSLLTYFISFKIIDLVEEGMEQAKSVMIITDDGKRMADTIYQRLGRTCTMMEGSGLISGDKCILYCVVTRIELPAIRQIVHQADVSAFVTISDVSEIVGNHVKQHPLAEEAE